MNRSDPRYPCYLEYQREYQRRRRQEDPDYRAKRTWAVHKCYWSKKERDSTAKPTSPNPHPLNPLEGK